MFLGIQFQNCLSHFFPTGNLYEKKADFDFIFLGGIFESNILAVVMQIANDTTNSTSLKVNKNRTAFK